MSTNTPSGDSNTSAARTKKSAPKTSSPPASTVAPSPVSGPSIGSGSGSSSAPAPAKPTKPKTGKGKVPPPPKPPARLEQPAVAPSRPLVPTLKSAPVMPPTMQSSTGMGSSSPIRSGPGAPPYARQNLPPGFDKKLVRPTLHPRRVVGGVRLQGRPPAMVAGDSAATIGVAALAGEAPAAEQHTAGWTWASARWMRIVEQRAPNSQLAEGLEYARAGQTRNLEVRPGTITGRVQGRMPQAYKTSIRMPTFTPEQWEKVLSAMSGQAKYAAALLAGELPPNIEDIFAPLGLALFPTDASDLSTSCECDVFTGKPREYGPLPPLSNPDGADENAAPLPPPPPPPPAAPSKPVPFCKHVCCLMYLIADKLALQPMSIFALRGLPEQDMLERLRQARALQGLQRTGAAAPVYQPHVPGISTSSAPLADLAQNFWAAAELSASDELDMPIGLPEVSHPLLRRIGPSPFQGAKFPITGLLATCYDVISGAVIQQTQQQAQQQGETLGDPQDDADPPLRP